MPGTFWIAALSSSAATGTPLPRWSANGMRAWQSRQPRSMTCGRWSYRARHNTDWVRCTRRMVARSTVWHCRHGLANPRGEGIHFVELAGGQARIGCAEPERCGVVGAGRVAEPALEGFHHPVELAHRGVDLVLVASPQLVGAAP